MMTAQYQAALHSYAEGRYEEATEQFSELLHEDPRNPKLHIWLGATFRKAGQMEYAKVQYQQVLTLTDDPDLLDLASTSLAQIQNKLAHVSHRQDTQEIPIHTKNHQADQAQEATYRALQQAVENTRKANGFVANGSVNHFNETMIDNGESTAIPMPKNFAGSTKIKSSNNGNGKVPPPSGVVFGNPSNAIEEEQVFTQLQENEKPPKSENLADTNNSSEVSAFKDTIKITVANIRGTKQDNQESALSPSGESVVSNRVKGNNSPIALEDIFKFSSVSQKVTLWGALVATIPAIALGLAAYQVGNGLLLSKTKQVQKSEAIALANVTGNFLRQQTVNVEVLQKLFVSTDLGLNAPIAPTAAKPNAKAPAKTPNPDQSLLIGQQRQYRQQLTNRLNLYAQAYPKYTGIALFAADGNLIAQSTNGKTLQVMSADLLKKTALNSTNQVLISDPTIGKGGTHLYFVIPIRSTDAKRINMLLQVEIPVEQLTNELVNANIANSGANNTKNSDFYLIDSASKYIASSQPVSVGGDALTNFAMLSDWRISARSSQSSELLSDDRNDQITAYAPVPNLQADNLLSWDLVTTIDKTKAIAGNQSLLIVIGIGIASTPILIAAIAFAMSRKLSTRLKHIRIALRDLKAGNTDLSFGNLSTEGNDELSDISLSINKMSEQFQTTMEKQDLEKRDLQLQVTKLFKILSKLAREENQNPDLSDEKILSLGKKVRAEMMQRHTEVENYRQQREEIQGRLFQMLKDVQALADGDFTVSTQSADGSLANVAIFFDDVMRGLQNIIGQVKSSANQVNASLGQNEQAINSLSDVSQKQLDMVTQSLDTMKTSQLSTSTIAGHTQQVVQSSQLVAEKVSDSDRSIDAVMCKVGELQNTVAMTAKRIKHLGMSSQKVVKAISTINEIAIKTNFLAINASLEASRTGDMNGSFVVVAEEVGELAARSVAASREVESLLINIQSETNAAMAAVESGSYQISESNTLAIAAKDSLRQIVQISQEIDGLMCVISEATISQVQTSEGVANLMHDISHMAKKTLASSSEASKLIKATREYSGELQQSLTHFKTR